MVVVAAESEPEAASMLETEVLGPLRTTRALKVFELPEWPNFPARLAGDKPASDLLRAKTMRDRLKS